MRQSTCESSDLDLSNIPGDIVAWIQGIRTSGMPGSDAYAAGMLGLLSPPPFCSARCGAVHRRDDADVHSRLSRLGLRRSNTEGEACVTPIRGPIGLRSARQGAALLDWVVDELAAPRAVWCRVQREPRWLSPGISAYESWAREMERIIDTGRRVFPPMREWLADLSARRTLASLYLKELAGRAGTWSARRLAWAGEIYSEEADSALRPALALTCRAYSARRSRSIVEDRIESLREAADLVRRAEKLAERAVQHLFEAILNRSHLTEVAGRTLTEPADAPLEGPALQEMIYLARAGQAPFRALAARRLSGASSDQAVATLAQLLYEYEARIATMALHSLQRISPDFLHGLLRSAISAQPGSPALASLLLALGENADDSTFEFLADFASNISLERGARRIAAWVMDKRIRAD